jgi:ABC-type nitrate/sulfonate/bicarbonate transport system substrate-binding protein
MFRSILLSVILVFSYTIVFAGTDPVVIAVPRTVSSIPILELSGGEYSGKKISCIFYDDHIIAMSEFVSGRVPFFVTGFSQGLSYYRSGGKVVLAGNLIWGMSSLVARDSFKSLEDFKGHTILVPFAGSPLDVQIRAIIHRRNLDKYITIQYAPIQQQIPLLLAGKASGGCLPESFPSKLISEKKGIRVFSFPDEWAKINKGERRTPQVAIFVKKEFYSANQKFVKDVIAAVGKQCRDINPRRAALAEKYAKTFNIDAQTLLSSLSFVVYEISPVETERRLIRDYQVFIGDKEIIGDEFFR